MEPFGVSGIGKKCDIYVFTSAHMWATGYNLIACFAPDNAPSVPILYVLAMKANVKLH